MRRRIVLVFGEDHNDRAALQHLIRALTKDCAGVAIQLRRKPLILSRSAARPKRRGMAEEIASLCKFAEDLEEGIAIAVVHRDCDATEPAHEEYARVMVADLRAAGVSRAVAATPAWEIEAWWMLFPSALAAIRPCWRRVDYGTQSVGRFRNAKERLIRDLRPTGERERRRCPDYQEADGIRVARYVADIGLRQARGAAISASFAEFAAALSKALL